MHGHDFTQLKATFTIWLALQNLLGSSYVTKASPGEVLVKTFPMFQHFLPSGSIFHEFEKGVHSSKLSTVLNQNVGDSFTHCLYCTCMEPKMHFRLKFDLFIKE